MSFFTEMADGFTAIQRHDVPDVMIVAHEEGTWLLCKGEEPKLLGEKADFDKIWQQVLLRKEILDR